MKPLESDHFEGRCDFGDAIDVACNEEAGRVKQKMGIIAKRCQLDGFYQLRAKADTNVHVQKKCLLAGRKQAHSHVHGFPLPIKVWQGVKRGNDALM